MCNPLRRHPSIDLIRRGVVAALLHDAQELVQVDLLVSCVV